MLQTSGPLFLWVALLCRLMMTTSAAEKLCFDSGVAHDEAGNALLMPIVTPKDHALLSLMYCPDEWCFECTQEINGMMLYAATCAKDVPASETKGMTCTQLAGHCSNATDLESCGKTILEIRNMTICRFSTVVNNVVFDGGYDVHCRDNCATAAFYYDEMWYQCKGCKAFCENWLNEKKAKYSGEFKLCADTGDCEVDGKPNPHVTLAASDVASDDPGSSSVIGAPVFLIEAAVAAVAAVLCLRVAL